MVRHWELQDHRRQALKKRGQVSRGELTSTFSASLTSFDLLQLEHIYSMFEVPLRLLKLKECPVNQLQPANTQRHPTFLYLRPDGGEDRRTKSLFFNYTPVLILGRQKPYLHTGSTSP